MQDRRILKWEISLGSILQTATLLGALCGGYVRFVEEHRAMRDAVDRALGQLDQVHSEYVRRDVLVERERVVSDHLAGIERRLDRIERALR